ncbi:Molybdopterin dinucleotide-binding domain-containing protein [Aromatoleum bremense]|nr:Molybdopterin dinucleotide-binding domain-containing protein [Aromatoleum bremense]
MKKYSAEAICELNPHTASRYGLKEGEMIWIESRKGRIQQRLKISEHVHPNVILAAFGWWDTEAEDNEYDWRKYNINILSEGDGANCPATGSVQLCGIPVRVYSEEQSWGNPPH